MKYPGILAAILAVCLLASLSACSGDEQPTRRRAYAEDGDETDGLGYAGDELGYADDEPAEPVAEQRITYECAEGCGETKQRKAGKPAPKCCESPMVAKT
jgi:hypothetical protein